jgi:hypothetical protein
MIEIEGDKFISIIPNMEWKGVTGRYKLYWKRI